MRILSRCDSRCNACHRQDTLNQRCMAEKDDAKVCANMPSKQVTPTCLSLAFTNHVSTMCAIDKRPAGDNRSQPSG